MWVFIHAIQIDPGGSLLEMAGVSKADFALYSLPGVENDSNTYQNLWKPLPRSIPCNASKGTIPGGLLNHPSQEQFFTDPVTLVPCVGIGVDQSWCLWGELIEAFQHLN